MTLTFKQGDTWSISWIRTDASGDPVSLSGVTILSQIRSGTFVLTFDAEIVSAAAGTYILTAPAAETLLVPARAYSFDVQFTDENGNVDSSETVQFIVTPDNSRSAV